MQRTCVLMCNNTSVRIIAVLQAVKKLHKSYKYRIYPNKKQQQRIDQTIETCRYLYNDFKVASILIKEYDIIAHEKLIIKNMVRNGHLAKSISDAGWGIFFSILSYKAESAGKTVIEADPKNISRICYSYDNIVPKKLSERRHNCPHCGFSEHRDVNAVKNILRKAVA